MTEQNEQLKQQLWNIANTLRGKMDADDFRDYILGFIFYKYLSRKMDLYASLYQKRGLIFYLSAKIHQSKKDENNSCEIGYLDVIKNGKLSSDWGKMFLTTNFVDEKSGKRHQINR